MSASKSMSEAPIEQRLPFPQQLKRERELPGSATISRWVASYSSPTVPPAGPPAQKVTPPKPKGQQYKPGDKVRHNIFGGGIVLKSEMEQDTEFVEVQFEGKIGKKRLSMDFAKLEKQ
jgi:DNA helicase-2/ATP-dependent DNA helicase PcrA